VWVFFVKFTGHVSLFLISVLLQKREKFHVLAGVKAMHYHAVISVLDSLAL
jgi:hypothetical protein